MKGFFLIVFTVLSVHASVFGCTKPVDSLGYLVKVTIPDTSNNVFFEKNKAVKFVSAMYIGTEPSLIFLSFDYKNEVFEIYDLTFRGDAYLLKEKYGTVHFKSAKAGIESIRLRGGISSWLNITEAAVYRDSVSFSFSLIDEFKMDASDWAVGSQAHYKSSIMPLGERIVNRLKQVKRLGAVDSVLVYQGTMTKYGYLKDLALVFGKQSTFSDVVAEELLGKETRNETDNTQADWNPAFVDRGKLDVMFRIFVKLEPDGSVTVENTKKLRSFIGR